MKWVGREGGGKEGFRMGGNDNLALAGITTLCHEGIEVDDYNRPAPDNVMHSYDVLPPPNHSPLMWSLSCIFGASWYGRWLITHLMKIHRLGWLMEDG